MSRISKVLRDLEGNGLMFWCPGCKARHAIYHGDGHGARWGWNGNVDKPTFTPSILVRSTELTALGEEQRKAWADAGYPKLDKTFDVTPTVCHSFVTDGKIQFLSDCSHELAGKIVDLPEWGD